jgi:hypothetical protein
LEGCRNRGRTVLTSASVEGVQDQRYDKSDNNHVMLYTWSFEAAQVVFDL